MTGCRRDGSKHLTSWNLVYRWLEFVLRVARVGDGEVRPAVRRFAESLESRHPDFSESPGSRCASGAARCGRRAATAANGVLPVLSGEDPALLVG